MRRCTMPTRSSPSSRIVRILALMPSRLPRSSEKRRPPNISSRTINSDQRSPTNSRPSAVPQASSYQRLSSAGDFLVIFSKTRPLSNDLRERVVAAIVGGESCRSVASRFGVAVSSVVKWSQRYRATGSVAPGKVGGHRKRVLGTASRLRPGTDRPNAASDAARAEGGACCTRGQCLA